MVSDTPSGVKNAYIDLPLPNTWNRQGAAVFGPHYSFDQSDPSATEIDEVGAGGDGSTPTTGAVLLVQLPMSVSDGGDYSLQLDVADRDSERFGVATAVSPNEIVYGSLDVSVVSPFMAVDDVRSVDEDSEDVALNVLTNDTFLTGYTGTLEVIAIDQAPTLGDVTISNGDLLYTPDPNVSGSDTLTYVLTDNQRGTVTGAVDIVIQPINDDPVAVSDTFNNIAEDSVDNELDVLGNDTDIDQDSLFVLAVTQPSHGSVTLSPNRTFLEYTPDAGFDGTDTFSYTVTDNEGGLATGAVTVNVAGENDPPIAVDDTANVAEDNSVTINPLDNDDPVDGGEVLSILSAVATSGNAAVVGGTQVTYSPPANFNGVDTIAYVISDGNGMQDTGTITVSVNPVNDAPVAEDDPVSGAINIVLNTNNNAIDVLANDSDVDGDTLSIASVGSFSDGGSATISNGQLLYTPATDFTGTETFTYTIEDPSGASSSATVEVEVLEFVPSSIAGSVFLDRDGDGEQDADESGVGSVAISLSGLNDLGETVAETSATDNSGNYVFNDLRPGTYTIVETQPSYFADGEDSIGSEGGTNPANDTLSVTLAEGVDATGYDFAEQGRGSGFRSIHDLFRSTSRTNVFAAINADTGEVVTQWTEGQWSSPTASVNYSASSGEVSVTVQDSGQTLTNTVEINTAPPSLMVGEEGSIRIVRLLTNQHFDEAAGAANTASIATGLRVARIGSLAAVGNSTAQGEPASGAGVAPQGESGSAISPPLEDEESDEAFRAYADAVDAIFGDDSLGL